MMVTDLCRMSMFSVHVNVASVLILDQGWAGSFGRPKGAGAGRHTSKGTEGWESRTHVDRKMWFGGECSSFLAMKVKTLDNSCRSIGQATIGGILSPKLQLSSNPHQKNCS